MDICLHAYFFKTNSKKCLNVSNTVCKLDSMQKQTLTGPFELFVPELFPQNLSDAVQDVSLFLSLI